MFPTGFFEVRSRKTGNSSRTSGGSLAILASALGIFLSMSGTTASIAQVSSTDKFLPGSWQPGAEAAREVGRSRQVRRPAVSTSTQLEDFDVQRRPSRARAARSAGPSAMRVVERKRTAKRVRVAALTNIGVGGQSASRPVQRRAQATRVASLGGSIASGISAPARSLTGGGIAWRASSGCLAGNLRSIVASLASSYGSVTVNSTCRNARHNRRVGGARKSWHLTGNAVDFRIHGGNVRSVYAYLRSNVGGLKHYGGGRFHIDNGPRRTF